jgi:HK97 family phage major capsid protein
MSKLTAAQAELRDLFNEAEELSRRTEQSKQTESRQNYLYARIKALSANTCDSDYRAQFFGDLFSGREVRSTPLQAGAQSILSTAGPEGGYLVPQEYHDETIFGMAQFDPLLNKDIVTLIESPDGSLRPYTVPGWDLSTFSAVKVNENAQQVPNTVPPTVSGALLNGYKYMSSIPITLELEEDMYEATQALIGRAYQIAFARGIGSDLVLGSGTNAPAGVIAGAENVYTLANSGKVTLDDIESIYFSVNRFHRYASKCAWLMNDSAYQLTRKAVDTAGNPLLKVIKDQETLMGKPVYVSPSLPEYNASLGEQAAGSYCVFGNLAQFYVRVSRLIINRAWQLPGYVEYGKALYTGIMRADATVFDPTGGSVPPLVTASLHE